MPQTTIRALESTVHRQICDYISLKYPQVFFMSDASGNLTPLQSKMASVLRSSRGVPDIFIAAPHGPYCGMWLEVKRDAAEVYKANGSLRENQHIQEQASVLQALMNIGYYANFAAGFEDAAAKLDWYFGLKPHTKSLVQLPSLSNFES